MRPWWLSPAVQDALAAELLGWGTDARVQKMRVAEGRVVVELHAHGTTHALLLDPSAPAWHLASAPPRRDEDAQPPAFQGLLRKYLANTRLAAVETGAGAHASMVFHTLSTPLRLVLDWAGTHANVLLVNDAGKVLGASLIARLAPRGLAVGKPFVAVKAPDAFDAAPWIRARAPDDPWAALPTHAALDQRQAHAPPTVPPVDVSVRRRVRAALDRETRLVRALESDLRRTEEEDRLRAAAERAKVQMGSLPRGATEWTLADAYNPEAPTLVIAVEPALGVQQNVERLFHRARRLERTRANVTPRLQQARVRAAALTAALQALDARAEGAEAQALAVVGADAAAPARGEKRGPSRRQPFRRFTTPEGYVVLVGRTRADNDLLTHRTARGNDLFLHARDAPGSHVILVLDAERPGRDRALLRAAQLAAHFSEARGHGVVDVRWTEVRHVRPVPGTPGLVTLAKERVLRVRLDDPELGALLGKETGASARS
ncbi:MAG: DUF814 domain-containing protein [Deltaproteobacteria bacterium]|nr:DUF814 domain-containing protein [Deltaproteobacteria bacterium]